MQDYDVENQFELGDLAEDSDEAEEGGRKRTSFDDGARAVGGRQSSGSVKAKKEASTPRLKSSDR